MEQDAGLSEKMLQFKHLQGPLSSGARLGRLTRPNLPDIETPTFLANTSRGVVPHISPDILRKQQAFPGLYFPLEDFVEKLPKRTPPIYLTPSPQSSPSSSSSSSSVLRSFTSLPSSQLTILGPRRIPPISSPNANTNTSISICTSVGFHSLPVHEYTSATALLRPDIIVGLADIPFAHVPPSQKRREKMVDRTQQWVDDLLCGRDGWDKTVERGNSAGSAVFAPVLPLPWEQMGWYVNMLLESEERRDSVAGLVFYDGANLVGFPEGLRDRVRLSVTGVGGPGEVLREVDGGMDVFVTGFVNEATEAGIALDFEFGLEITRAVGEGERVVDGGQTRRPLGLDMWDPAYAASLVPLSESCDCYACTKHHRAYIQHLLSAKEMTAWVLLQLHNHQVLASFFASIRKSIADGSFEECCRLFEARYESELPEGTGRGPRVRGYQFKSEGPGEQKRNKKAWGGLKGEETTVVEMRDEGKEKVTEAPLVDVGANAGELQDQGFGTVEGKT